MPLAYSITGAAKASSLDAWQIVEAIRSGKLKVRRTGEKRNPLIIGTDLQAWLESLPEQPPRTATILD